MSSSPASDPIALSPKRRRRLLDRGHPSTERWLERIFREHHQEIYRYCLAIVRSSADAEDALQATMTAAARSLPGEEREIAIRPWLFRVAHNEAVSIIRKRRESPSADELVESAVESAADRSEQRQRLRTLVADLQALPDRQRSGLIMRELSGLSYEEIAAVLRCGEGAARQVVYEARSALATRAEGREMECKEARQAISDGDRRRLRGRKLKAHLSSCEGCNDFQAAIAARQNDLRMLCPPVPAAAATGLLAAVVGASSGSGSAVGGGSAAAGAGAVGAGVAAGGGGLAAGAAGKGAAILAAAALAAGAADLTGVAELPRPLGQGDESSVAEPAAAEAPGEAAFEVRDPERPAPASAPTPEDGGRGGQSAGGGKGKGRGKGKGSNGAGKAKGRGQGPGAPAAQAPGRQGTGPGVGGNAGGNPGAPGGGKTGSPPQAGGNPSPPTGPNAGGDAVKPAPVPPADPGPPAHAKPGGGGKGQGAPGGGRDE